MSSPSKLSAALRESGDDARYRGQTKDTVRHGTGTFTFDVGGNALFTYVGPWQKGAKHGDGGTFCVNGLSTYSGQFLDGEITGRGEKVFATGAIYDGDFVEGEMCGEGQWTSADGDECYLGGFVNNQRHGAGQITYAHNTSIFRGTFRRHKRVGRGSYVIKNVLFLDAKFHDNVADGPATAHWHRVARFRGALVRGVMQGRARFTAADGSYDFAGKMEGGMPAADISAAYLFASLDRSGVAVAAAAPAAALAAPGKGGAAPPAKDKGGPVTEEPPEVMVLAGGDLGKLVVRAGTQVHLRVHTPLLPSPRSPHQPLLLF